MSCHLISGPLSITPFSKWRYIKYHNSYNTPYQEISFISNHQWVKNLSIQKQKLFVHAHHSDWAVLFALFDINGKTEGTHELIKVISAGLMWLQVCFVLQVWRVSITIRSSSLLPASWFESWWMENDRGRTFSVTHNAPELVSSRCDWFSAEGTFSSFCFPFTMFPVTFCRFLISQFVHFTY